MQKHFLKVRKVITHIACSPLIFISNNSELAAKFLKNDFEQPVPKFEIKETYNSLFQGSSIKEEKNFFIAENKEKVKEESVLVSEIIIEGWENHPEGRKLELAAYDSMSIKPGSIVDNVILNKDLNSIYASGWFSGVKIKSQEGPLGVKLIVNIVPNPILKRVEIKQPNSVISNEYLDEIFNNFYGTTLNLNELQNKIEIIKKRYVNAGYSLARITGPDRISENGIVTLNISEGIISDIKLRFLGADGESLKDGKARKGKLVDFMPHHYLMM